MFGLSASSPWDPASHAGGHVYGSSRASLIRVHNVAISLDGCSTGEGKSLEKPFGHAGARLVERFAGTLTFRQGPALAGVDGRVSRFARSGWTVATILLIIFVVMAPVAPWVAFAILFVNWIRVLLPTSLSGHGATGDLDWQSRIRA